jgi:hypothetical protein
VCSVNLLKKLHFNKSDIFLDSLSIQWFDNVGKKLLGFITLPIRAGKLMLQTPIHLMPHDLSYNLLLGRTWIHAMNGVPYTLYRKMKYFEENKVYTLDEDPKPNSFLIEKNKENPLKTLTSTIQVEPMEVKDKEKHYEEVTKLLEDD